MLFGDQIFRDFLLLFGVFQIFPLPPSLPPPDVLLAAACPHPPTPASLLPQAPLGNGAPSGVSANALLDCVSVHPWLTSWRETSWHIPPGDLPRLQRATPALAAVLSMRSRSMSQRAASVALLARARCLRAPAAGAASRALSRAPRANVLRVVYRARLDTVSYCTSHRLSHRVLHTQVSLWRADFPWSESRERRITRPRPDSRVRRFAHGISRAM